MRGVQCGVKRPTGSRFQRKGRKLVRERNTKLGTTVAEIIYIGHVSTISQYYSQQPYSKRQYNVLAGSKDCTASLQVLDYGCCLDIGPRLVFITRHQLPFVNIVVGSCILFSREYVICNPFPTTTFLYKVLVNSTLNSQRINSSFNPA